MARRPNYGFEKRQKEMLKQQKKDEKAEKKRARKENADDGGTGEEAEVGEQDGEGDD